MRQKIIDAIMAHAAAEYPRELILTRHFRTAFVS